MREAIRMFGDKTYPMVGMRELSEAVGILPGSLYSHISSKEALLMRIVEEGITHYIDAISAAIATADPADVRLRFAIRAHLRVLAETAEQTRVAFDQWHYLGPENQAQVVALRQTYQDLFLGIVQDGIRDGAIRPVPHLKATVLSMIGGLNFAAEWYSPSKSLVPDEIADALTDAFLHGLAGPKAKRRRAGAASGADGAPQDR